MLFALPWQQLVSGLIAADQAFVFNQSGYNLRALGRLPEAAQLIQAGLAIDVSLGAWNSAALFSGNLSELYLIMGNLSQALAYAQRSIELADRSGEGFWKVANRTKLAAVLYQSGRMTEAEAAFRVAEEIQKEWQPDYPLLYSLQGYRYCDLLLGQGRYQEVQDRVARTLKWAAQPRGLLSKALDNLSLGRASLLKARQEDGGAMAPAEDFLQHAVNGLRQAGYQDNLPRGLLARAEMYRLMGDSLERAQTDLAEAQRIAERGSMGLHLADCHLEWARLCLATGEREAARAHWTTAKAMIERMGYHRRDKEVEEIASELGETA